MLHIHIYIYIYIYIYDISSLRINDDMNDETMNVVRFKIRNAYLRAQIKFLFTIRDVQNTKSEPATG